MSIIPFPSSSPGNSNNKLPPSGGGPYDGGMESRVERLEKKMDGVQDTLNAIQVTLAEIRASMATKDDIAKLDVKLTKIETTTATASALSASETRLAVLEERTAHLLTTRTAGIMLGIAIAILTMAARWHDILSHFH